MFVHVYPPLLHFSSTSRLSINICFFRLLQSYQSVISDGQPVTFAWPYWRVIPHRLLRVHLTEDYTSFRVLSVDGFLIDITLVQQACAGTIQIWLSLSPS